MMLDRSLRFQITICVVVLAARQAYAADAAPVQPAEVAAVAQTILAEHCYKCHGSAKQEGELRLDVAAAAIKGGESGAVIKPSHADDSLLIEYVSGKGDTVMPPKGKRLTEAEVATLRKWINGGEIGPQPRRRRRPIRSGPIGHTSRSTAANRRALKIGSGCGTKSMRSSWRSWSTKT